MIFLPNGGYSLLPLTLVTLGWIGTIIPDGCDFVRVTGPAVEYITRSDVLPYIEAGMNSYRVPTYYPDEVEWRTIYTDSCLTYGEPTNKYEDNDFEFDFAWRFGKTCNFLGTLFGGGCTFFLWTAAFCLTLPRNTWRWIGILIFLSAICQAFSFIWMATNICQRGTVDSGAGCHLFFGSNVCIFSSIAYGAAAFAILIKYPEPKIVKMMRREIVYNMNQLDTILPSSARQGESTPTLFTSSRSGSRSSWSNLLT